MRRQLSKHEVLVAGVMQGYAPAAFVLPPTLEGQLSGSNVIPPLDLGRKGLFLPSLDLYLR